MISLYITKRKRKKNMKHVQQISQKLQKIGLQYDIDKCEFFIQKIKNINLLITSKNIKMDKKNTAVFDRSIFENLKNIQSFLSFANFYKHFIRDFLKLTGLLNALTKQNSTGALNNQKKIDNFKIVLPRFQFYYITIRINKQW